MKLAIINGPNLNLLGSRENDIYGDTSFDDYFNVLKSRFKLELDYFQSNIEGELIDYLQKVNCDGIVLNGGGYTHTSVSLRDCISAIDTPVVEVHLSNISARESFRHDSLLSPVCEGSIYGFGLKSYDLAIEYFIEK
ncbi:3-dehydroquinate dehydratase [Crocinitomicaceae bacterium]|jgi:3-dehydroquinate dehydratase-2|nr:3-dehydroquinate dehydratase [Flavobacteriales bacterium]MDB4340423.1 3-dehydroquinate dehydratase [Crocinitomicaceae bacterium]MBT5932298.1 3-dehydroquinate dehydratase [Flavobacteriales bacterium]MDC1266817.1 3-dehydroquinate dehydratase [Crocinitomicaceae bacterium]MDC3308744.1 3-dehydroquinate dehydratase [Crocinitomicaceae bacterium]